MSETVTREKLDKIARLAGDERGDAHTRQVAAAKLAAYRNTHPDLFVVAKPEPIWTPPSQPHPGTQKSDEWRMRFYLDLSNWKRSLKGNFTTVFSTPKGAAFRVTLFSHKTKTTFGYSLNDLRTDALTWSSTRYPTIGEAHRGSWQHLSTL